MNLLNERQNSALYLDNTMLSALHQCPSKFYWRHGLHLVKKVEGASPALSFGIAIHKGLETYYLTNRDLMQAITSFVTSWRELGSPEDDKRNEMVGANILSAYHDKYLGDSQWKIIEVEGRICVEVANDLIFCGRVDLVIEWMGLTYVVDHKTTSSMSSYIPKPNHQFTGYISALQIMGIPAIGAVVNLIGVYKTKTDFSRLITTRSKLDKDRWLHSLIEAKTRIDTYLDLGEWPMYTTACFMCPYKDLCNAENEEILHATVNAYYTAEPWEPWKIGTEKYLNET